MKLVTDFYFIAIKQNFEATMHYGQQDFDFDEGVMSFIAPGQVFSIQVDPESFARQSGWILLVHPDFFWGTALAKRIKQYEYFEYATHEALFLSEKEEQMITGIMQNIWQEYEARIDDFSQDIVISHIEALLHYADRFYHRQFITRKITHHKILEQLEEILNKRLTSKGLPTAQFVADSLNVSPNYLSRLLKTLTGQSTQQHIHEKLIAKAKERLSTTDLTVAEVAYELGFEHPQSFSKLFKTKTGTSPLSFR